MEEIPLGFWTAYATRLCELNRLGSRTEECESHVSEAEEEQPNPEYRRTRETRWEDGGTTLQA